MMASASKKRPHLAQLDRSYIPVDRRQASLPVDFDHRHAERRVTNIPTTKERRGTAYQFKSILPGHGNDPSTIKTWIKQANSSSHTIAKRCKVQPSAVSQVVNGRTRSKKLESALAKATGRTLAELFPSWYEKT